jgi:hypothetical protein
MFHQQLNFNGIMFGVGVGMITYSLGGLLSLGVSVVILCVFNAYLDYRNSV